MTDDQLEPAIQLTIKVVRHDGEAVLQKWVGLPRVPVAGDFVETIEECFDEVVRVELRVNDGIHNPTAFVHLEDDEDFSDNYEYDADWDAGRPEHLREGMSSFLEAGFEVSDIATCWVTARFGIAANWVNPSHIAGYHPLPGLDPEEIE